MGSRHHIGNVLGNVDGAGSMGAPIIVVLFIIWITKLGKKFHPLTLRARGACQVSCALGIDDFWDEGVKIDEKRPVLGGSDRYKKNVGKWWFCRV